MRMNLNVITALALAVLLSAGLSAQVGQWGTGTLVPELSSSGNDYYPFLSRDNLTFRIASSRTDIPGSPGGWDIYRAVRPNPHTTFGPITREPGAINGSTNDLGHHIMGDELTAYVANSQAGGVGGHDIWMYTRTSPTAPWAAGVNLPQVNSSSTDYCVTVTDDHLEMYLTGASVLKRATRATISQPWGTAAPVAELNTPVTPVNCYMPSITGDGLTMYVCMSGAPGGLGSHDIYVVTRTHRSSTWGTPVHLGSGVNTSSSDHRPSISPDGRQLFFCSTGTNVYVSHFTGLSYQNLPQIGSPFLLHLTDAAQFGMFYQVGLALSNANGIPLKGFGKIPLDVDNLLVVSTSNLLPQIFNRFHGQLDNYGEATAQLQIPKILGLVGIYFHAAALTYNAGGVRSVTNGLSFAIHR